jgi:hypothetical protein
MQFKRKVISGERAMFRKGLLAAGLTLGLAWAAPASADPILFNPAGTGAAGALQITLLDWGVGNAIALGANALSIPGTVLQLDYQANLDTAKNGSSIKFSNGNNNQFFTAVATFAEQVASNSVNPVTGTGSIEFQLAPVQTTNIFRIYANSTGPGEDIDGVCFVCGTVIMEGHITSFVSPSVFSTSGLASPPELDQNGVDNYGPGYAGSPPTRIDSLNGSGSVNVRIKIDSYLEGYFPELNVGANIDFSTTNSSTILPYDQIDPARCFFATTGGYAANTCGGGVAGLAVQNGATLTSLGTINGFNGPNTILQADANSSFTLTPSEVPEPATLSLLALGLLGSAAARRRNKAAKK